MVPRTSVQVQSRSKLTPAMYCITHKIIRLSQVICANGSRKLFRFSRKMRWRQSGYLRTVPENYSVFLVRCDEGREGRRYAVPLISNLSTRVWWVVKSKLRQIYTRENFPGPIVHEGVWASRPVWRDVEKKKSLDPTEFKHNSKIILTYNSHRIRNLADRRKDDTKVIC